MAEFQVNGRTYRCDKMPVLRQYDIARRWSPVFVQLAMVLKQTPPPPPGNIARALVVISSPIPQADNDYVISSCLQTVFRKEGANFQRFSPGPGQLQFEDTTLEELMEVIFNVVSQNGLPDFFSVSPEPESSPDQTAKSS